MNDPGFLSRADGLRLAYRYQPGAEPCLVFLPGYASDMRGGKAQALAAWAGQKGQAVLRLDYGGCGESDGGFEDGSLVSWRDDALLVINHIGVDRLVLVGSSMGGWLALLLAQLLGDRVAGMVGLAAAPDFTDWGFSQQEKARIETRGRLEQPSGYGPEPMVTTKAFWQSGQDNLLLRNEIPVFCPVRLIQGQCDPDVPWTTALTIAERLCSADVQVHLVKDGDHRLSRDQDLVLMLRVTGGLLELP
jgi:pimeloyl-ACP methyl ester carboxylesterase